MGLLSQLGLKPTSAMLGKSGAEPTTRHTADKADKAGANGKPAADGKGATGMKSPEMVELVARFQDVMGRIKALEPAKAPAAVALKLAAIAAGKLSTSPKGIVAANAALDKVESQLIDAKKMAADAQPAAAIDVKQVSSDARARVKAIEARGRKAIAADKGNTQDGPWLTKGVASTLEDIDRFEKDSDSNQRLANELRRRIDWLDDGISDLEADMKGQPRPSQAQVEDPAKVANESRKRLLALADRGKKALAADPRNPNVDWLADTVKNSDERIARFEERKTVRDAEELEGHFEWLEESIGHWEERAEANAKEAGQGAGATSETAPEAPKKTEDSPALKKLKAQLKQVMSEVGKLAADRNPKAKELKKAAVKAGNMATNPKGIEKAGRALDLVMGDAIDAKAEARKARDAADKAKAASDQAAAETFDLTVGGKKLSGLHREEAMKELRLERGKLDAQLEAGWALHVEQMNLPNEIPFQAWLTSGVDAIKSLVPGNHRAKMPDLNIWDPARDMINECKRAERTGDVKAFEALLPKIAKAIPAARSQIGSYKDQMEGAAQTGVDAGRFVEDTAASGIGAIAEKRGGKAGKVAAQAAAQGVFASVEQLTEWAIGTRKKADPGAIAQKVGEEAIGAVFKELIAGKLKPLFKNAFGSYLGPAISDAELKAMELTRESFMTAGQKWFSEFAPKVLAGAIKSSVGKFIYGKMPDSKEAMVEGVAQDLFKGSAKQMIVDGIKEIAKHAIDAK